MAQEKWQTDAHVLLDVGYGVEDIAIKLGVTLPDVQMMVRLMRENGVLDVIYEVDE